jgi:hypothetical protein
MYQDSEVLVLVLAVGLIPIFVWTLKRVEMRDKGLVGLALGASFLAYIATIAEGYAAHVFWNTAEHALYMVAGISFGLFALRVFRRTIVRGGS